MADILIRMKMPKCCCCCPCFNDEYYYCQAADIDLGRIPVESRHPNCPLIEVQPHGDLVDINALKLAIVNVDYVNKHDYLKGVLNAINHAPTVIEASEVET